MKGGIAVILAALTAFEASPGAAALGYDVLINADEETGSLSSAQLIAELAKGKVAALTYEPSALPDGTLAGARPGSGNYAVVITGRAAHAGRNPHEGRNAIVAAAALVLGLKAIERTGLAINPARIDGGGANNVVPDHAVLRFNIRPANADALAHFQGDFRKLSLAVESEHEVSLHCHGGVSRPPKPLDPPALALFGLVRDCGAALGQTIAWQNSGGVCDGNNIAACGVPVVDTMGVRGGAIHSPDEYLIVASLAERAALSAVVLTRLGGRSFSMTFRIRAARQDDAQPLYEMAKLTGGGFTNLPADRKAIAAKLDRSARAYARTDDSLSDELFVIVLENVATGDVRGTAQIFTQVGRTWPFYSYRQTALSQHSKELGRTFRAEMLALVTDLEGASEVGGLFLHPSERAGGLGLLLARSRYLFIAMHRARFADRILAELRGIIDERGGSPFWDGVAGRFFGMNFQEADYFNAINGNQFIADLMPKHPVYVAMLSESARSAIGLPHPSGRAAMRMLEEEGFAQEGYIDIFDGGPTMTAKTDRVHSIALATQANVAAIGSEGAQRGLIATGTLADFRCCPGQFEMGAHGLTLDSQAAAALAVGPGDSVWSVAR